MPAGVLGLILSLCFSPVAQGASAKGSSPRSAAPPTPAAAVATVGSVRVDAAALEQELVASHAATPAQKQAVLEEMIRFELFHAAALMDGYDKKPEVAAAVRRLIVGAFVREQLEPRLAALQVADEEIKEYFEKHQVEFTIPQAVRAAVIKIAVPPKAADEKRAELRARAEAARAEALALPAATASFGSVAVKYSEEQVTRYRGGDAGWLRSGQADSSWDKEVADAIFALQKPGEVGPVVAAASGFYVVKLVETRASATRTLEEVRDQVSHQVLAAKKAQVERQLYAELTAKIPISVDEQALAAVPLPEPRDTHPRTPPALPGP